MRNEAALQAAITKYLRSVGALVYKFASPAHAGVPDLMVVHEGRVLFIEVKHPNGRGRLTPLQEITIGKIRDRGIDVHVADSLDTIKKIFPRTGGGDRAPVRAPGDPVTGADGVW